LLGQRQRVVILRRQGFGMVRPQNLGLTTPTDFIGGRGLCEVQFRASHCEMMERRQGIHMVGAQDRRPFVVTGIVQFLGLLVQALVKYVFARLAVIRRVSGCRLPRSVSFRFKHCN
jgi:hypothetical protein